MKYDYKRKWLLAGFMMPLGLWWAGVGVTQAGTISEVSSSTHLPIAGSVTITLRQGGADVTDTWLPSPGQSVEIVVNGLANPTIRLVCPPNSSGQGDNGTGPCPATNASMYDATAPATAVTVADATNASPIVISTAPTNHGFATGDKVLIGGVKGNTAANGVWSITNVTSTQFSLNGSTGNGARVAPVSPEPPAKAMRWPSVHPFLNATTMKTSAYKGTCTNYGSNTDLSADYTLSGSTLTAQDCGGMAVILVNNTHHFIIPQDSDADGIPDLYEKNTVRVSGAGSPGNLQFTGNNIVGPSGTWNFFEIGEWITVTGATQAANNGPATVTDKTATGLTTSKTFTAENNSRAQVNGLVAIQDLELSPSTTEAAPSSDVTPAPDLTCVGVCRKGDGLSNLDEYRGFIVSNASRAPGGPFGTDYKHIRTSPSAKDLFVHVVNGQCAPPTPQGTFARYFPASGSPDLFAFAYTLLPGFQIHLLDYKPGLDNDSTTAVTPTLWEDFFDSYTVASGIRFTNGTGTEPATDRQINKNTVFPIPNPFASTTVQKGVRLVECQAPITDTQTPKAVTNARNSSGKIELTVTNHGYSTGNTVIVAGVTGVPTANGTWVITVPKNSPNAFTLNNSTFAGAYTSGGTVIRHPPAIGALGLTPWGTPNKVVSQFGTYAGNAIVFSERARKDIEVKLIDAGQRQIFWAEWNGTWNLYPAAQQLTGNIQDFLTTRYIQFLVGHELAHAHRLRPTTASANHTSNAGSILNANVIVSHEGTTGPGTPAQRSTFQIPYQHQTADQQEIRFGH